MQNKSRLKMNITIFLSICLALISITIFIFNYYNSYLNNNFNNFFDLKNGKTEIEINFLNNNENQYIKFVNNIDEVNKSIKSSIYYKKDNKSYKEITDLIFIDNDLYINVKKILSNLKNNDSINELLKKHYSDDEVKNILNLLDKNYKNKYIKLNIDNLGASNLFDSYNVLSKEHFSKLLLDISKIIDIKDNEIVISSEKFVEIIGLVNNYIFENKNELFNIVIENSLYINEKEFIEKPFFYRNIIEKYSSEIIDNKSDLILLLQNNQKFIAKDIHDYFNNYLNNLVEDIKNKNLNILIKNNDFTLKQSNENLLKIKFKYSKDFENIIVDDEFVEYFEFINNFKNEFYSILGFSSIQENSDKIIDTEWFNNLNIDSILDNDIKDFILSFQDNIENNKYYYPEISESNGFYELVYRCNMNDEYNYLLLSFEKKNNKINVVEKLLSEEFNAETFVDYRLSNLIKFTEKYNGIFKSDIDVNLINNLYDKMLNSQETYVSDMIYNNEGYIYISFNKIDKVLILRVIECYEN